MDDKLVLFDIYVETPVGWLDNRKKSGHIVKKLTVGWLDDPTKSGHSVLKQAVGLLDGIQKVKVRYMLGKPCWMIG